MVRLTEVQRRQVIALLMQGQRQQPVARHFGVHVSTIERLVRRLGENGRVADRPRSGRPRVTSQRQDRAIRLAHLRNRHLTATETTVNKVSSHNSRIHTKTVRNRLREFGLRARRPNVGLPLSRARRARRMAWVTAQSPRRFPMRQCRRVFFTDESLFTPFPADGQRRLYRRRFAEACVFERDRYGGGSVMVWGGISHGVKSPLIVVPGILTAVRYRDEILRPVAVPLVQQHQMTFQHDNARPHVARVCQDFLANNNIVPLDWPLDWPPYSPDLAPIEHLWDELDRRVRRRRNTPNTLGQLRTALLEEWENIPMRKINALVNSMQRRIRAVINARGGYTRY